MKFILGRSMVEMLGVLAIVGLLSIGGIIGLRYTMERYRILQTQEWLSRAHFAIIENCSDDDRCWVDNMNFAQRRALLCSTAGSDFCHSDLTAEVVKHPYFKDAGWLVHMWNEYEFSFYFYFLDKRTCEVFIQHDWANLSEVMLYEQHFLVDPDTGKLTQTQKDIMKKGCPISGNDSIVFTFRIGL